MPDAYGHSWAGLSPRSCRNCGAMEGTERVRQPCEKARATDWSSVGDGFMSSVTDEWATPRPLFDELDALFNFDLDPCATDRNHKCERYFTRADDGLNQSWEGARVYMNPPYGRGIDRWVAKAATEPDVAVCLIPARTDTGWWHRWCMKASEIWLVEGRLHFDGVAARGHNAPFPSAVIVFTKPATPLIVKSWTPHFGQEALAV